MPSPSRFRWTLVVAVVAHASAYAWAVQAARERALRGPSSAPVVTTETDVEIEPPPAEPPRATAQPPAESLEPAAVARLDAHRTPPAARGGAGPDAPLEAAPVSSVPTANDGSWTFSPTIDGAPGGGPLSGGALGTAVRAGVDATLAEDRKRSSARKPQILPLYSPHDMELGLVPGSALATLARDLIRRSRVPTVGHALLEFDTDGAGLVASVHVLDASSGRAEWEEVAAQIAAESRAKPVAVPNGANGIAITMDVTSALKTVNGATPTDNPLAKAFAAINDPVGAATDTPPLRVVAARIVDVKVF